MDHGSPARKSAFPGSLRLAHTRGAAYVIVMQPKKPNVHVGVFDRIADADRAVHELGAAGIPKERITVICPTCTTEKYEEYKKREPSGSHAVAGAATGGAIGAVLGGLAAVAAGTAAAAATGGAALLVAGTLLAGSGGGAVFGGFVGAMLTRGMEREVADFYDQALEKGQILVAVERGEDVTPEQVAAADRIFAAIGSENVTLRPT